MILGYPKIWKIARLNKKLSINNIFKTQCLLNTVGKVLENLTETRLRQEIEEKGEQCEKENVLRNRRKRITK